MLKLSCICRPSEETSYVVITENCGKLTVHVQGKLRDPDEQCVFLTVHDLGTNHMSMVDFVNSDAMSKIKKNALFIHVDVPGHEKNARDLHLYDFPPLSILGEELIAVLNFFKIQRAIGIGDGAGANVLGHCALVNPSRLPAIVLVNCAAEIMTSAYLFHTHYMKWIGPEISDVELNFLTYHKFGRRSNASHQTPVRPNLHPSTWLMAMMKYRSRLQRDLNINNAKLYVRAFLLRNPLQMQNCRSEVMLIAGLTNPYAIIMERIHKKLGNEKSHLVKVVNVGDVFTEAKLSVAVALLLLCQTQDRFSKITAEDVKRKSMRQRRFGRPM